MVMHEIFIAGH